MFTLAIKAKVQLHGTLSALYGEPSDAYQHAIVPLTVNAYNKVCVQTFSTYQGAVTALKQYYEQAVLESGRAAYSSDEEYYQWLDMADFIETNLFVAPISEEQVEYLENTLGVDVFFDTTGFGLLHEAVMDFFENSNTLKVIEDNPVLLNSLPRLQEH